jgi:hypothetical protein
MIEALTYKSMIHNIKSNLNDVHSRKTIGILLGDPNCVFVRDNIINRINYFHHKSNEGIDFYFPGYGAYWYGYYGKQKTACTVDEVEWSFSEKMYCEFINELEIKSNWRYSGETELIIIDYAKEDLDFSNTMTFWLDKMVKDKIIYSPANFFTSIFNLFKEENTTYTASDKLALKSMGNKIVDIIKNKMPSDIIKLYDSSKWFCIRDFRKL